MSSIVLSVKEVEVVQKSKTVLPKVSFDLYEGQSLAIIGDNDLAKGKLIECISGKSSYRGMIKKNDSYSKLIHLPAHKSFTNRSNLNSFYYQQRYNSHDANDSYTVREVLNSGSLEVSKTIKNLSLEELLDKPLLQLSNGENKKVQLAQALMEKPKILLLEDPFTGLDVKTRKVLSDIFLQLKNDGIILVFSSDLYAVPKWVSHGLKIEINNNVEFGEVCNLVSPTTSIINVNFDPLLRKTIPSFEHIVKFEKVNVSYNGVKIIENIDWHVKQGDRWLIKGPNGSGKSTLLSLINGDNPQAFANKITLFDRKKGTGESIWDIKKHIGYFSPEMYLHFNKNMTALQAVRGGLRDTIYSKIPITKIEEQIVTDGLEIWGLEHLQNVKLYDMSSQDRRLILLLRTFIKDPALLILDEPYQGLNFSSISLMNKMIMAWTIRNDRTLLFVSHYDEKLPDCFSHELEMG